jgi:hypothetical protein
MKKWHTTLALAAVAFLPASLPATTITFNGASPNVGSAINSDGFFVSSDTHGLPLFGSHADAYDFHLDASGTDYSDAGLLLFLDGGLTLGELQSVSVDSTGSPLAVNLWLDTGNDGSYFAYGGLSGYQFTGLNGDSYAGCGAPTIDASSSCYILGGLGAGTTRSLADLQAGSVAGIDAATRVALWIGITNPGGQTLSADINSITVNATPEPASFMLFGTALAGLFFVARRRQQQRAN